MTKVMDPAQKLQNQPTQQTTSGVQLRNDLQPTGSNVQNGNVNPNQAANSVTQDGLSAPTLRVGDSATTVTNTTKTTISPNSSSVIVDYTWLWLAVPLVIAIVFFWPFKRKATSHIEQPEPVDDESMIAPSNKTKKKLKKGKKTSRR